MANPVHRCGIYAERPRVCREYPKIDSWTPKECTYTFYNGERYGKCDCGVAACCAVPREKGLPGGSDLPASAGGLPCKHLVVESEKTSAVTLNRSEAVRKAIEG